MSQHISGVLTQLYGPSFISPLNLLFQILHSLQEDNQAVATNTRVLSLKLFSKTNHTFNKYRQLRHRCQQGCYDSCLYGFVRFCPGFCLTLLCIVAMAFICDICWEGSAVLFPFHCCVTASSEKRLCSTCAWAESCVHRHRSNSKIRILIILPCKNNLFECRCPFCKTADPVACTDDQGFSWSVQHYVWHGQWHTWWLSELGKQMRSSQSSKLFSILILLQANGPGLFMRPGITSWLQVR